MPKLLAGDGHVLQAGTEPAPALRHRERGDTEAGELPPQRLAGRMVARRPPACGAGYVGRGERIMQGCAELFLLCGPHPAVLLRPEPVLLEPVLIAGSPSSRSAITVRWISFVPA